MTDEEKITDLQRHSATNDMRIGNLETKFELFMKSQEDFKTEMRDRDNQIKAEMRNRDNQRHAEIAELRNDIKEIYKTTDSKIESINKSLSTMQNQNVLVIIGVIAIAVAVFLK